MQNYTILTIAEHHSHVCHLITKPPHHLHHSAIIILGWCGQYMCVNGNCWYRQATTAVRSKHIIFTVTQVLFLGILWVVTKNSEQLVQES